MLTPADIAAVAIITGTFFVSSVGVSVASFSLMRQVGNEWAMLTSYAAIAGSYMLAMSLLVQLGVLW